MTCVVCKGTIIENRPKRVRTGGLGRPERIEIEHMGWRCEKCGIHYDALPKSSL